MGFNFGAGLSEMGKSIAGTAGDMILNSQRADLERQRIELAESLAEGRETRGRTQQAEINDKAATKDRDWRSGESILNRSHETELEDTRQSGANERSRLERGTQMAIHADSEANANVRAQVDLAARVDQAREMAQSDREKTLLNAAVAAATQSDVLRDEKGKPLETASGSPIIRKNLDSEKLYDLLRGNPALKDMAAIFAPKPSAAKKGNVDGKPPLSSFMK